MEELGNDQMPDSQQRNDDKNHAHSDTIILPEGVNSDRNLDIISNDIDNELLSILKDIDKYNSYPEFFQCLEGEPSEPRPKKKVATPRVLPSAPVVSPSGLINYERSGHQQRQSLDWSSSLNCQLLRSSMEGSSQMGTRKVMSMQKLVDIALVNPKRAERMWANRQSAARSKEKKMRYMRELEQRVQALQRETTILTTQISLLQSNISGMKIENSELKLLLQSIEQRIPLQDALNEALNEEIKWLRITESQMSSSIGALTSLGVQLYENLQQFYHRNDLMQPRFQAQQQQIFRQNQPQLQQIVHLQQEQQTPNDPRIEGSMTSENNIGEDSLVDNNDPKKN